MLPQVGQGGASDCPSNARFVSAATSSAPAFAAIPFFAEARASRTSWPAGSAGAAGVAEFGMFTVFEIAPDRNGWTAPIIRMWPMYWMDRDPFDGLNAQSNTG